MFAMSRGTASLLALAALGLTAGGAQSLAAKPKNGQPAAQTQSAPPPQMNAIASGDAIPQTAGSAAPQNAALTHRAALIVPIHMSVNEARILRFSEPVQTVVIANPDIASVDVRSTTTALLVARKAGRTTMFGLGEDDRIIQSSDIMISHDMPSMLDSLRQAMPHNAIELHSTETGIIMSGSVADAEESALATRIVAQYVGDPAKVVNRLIFNAPDQVQLRVRIAEVQRSALKNLGINWEAVASAGKSSFGAAFGDAARLVTLPAAPTNTAGSALYGNFPGKNLTVTSVLDILEQKGLAVVLAQPSLTAMSGQTASFLAGGEIPVPVPISSTGGSLVALQWKQYGVFLTFTPVIQSGGRIELKVNPEVSSLDPGNAVQYNGYNVPAIATRKTETTVSLGSGDSFVIAGLLSESTARNLNQLPGIGDIPVLGALAKSTHFQRNETELLIVVTAFLAKATSNSMPLPTDPVTPAVGQPVATLDGPQFGVK